MTVDGKMRIDAERSEQVLDRAANLLSILSDVGGKGGASAESLKEGYDSLKAFTNATQKGGSGGRIGAGRTARGGMGNANRFAEPIVLMASPSGIALSTQQSTSEAADKHVNIVSGASTHIASGKSLIASISEKLSLFVQNAGMKLFAAKGKVEVQAHSDGIELTAQKGVKIVATTQTVEMAGKSEVLLTSGGAYMAMASGKQLPMQFGPVRWDLRRFKPRRAACNLRLTQMEPVRKANYDYRPTQANV